jgi:hypothetical protein
MKGEGRFFKGQELYSFGQPTSLVAVQHRFRALSAKRHGEGGCHKQLIVRRPNLFVAVLGAAVLLLTPVVESLGIPVPALVWGSGGTPLVVPPPSPITGLIGPTADREPWGNPVVGAGGAGGVG